jgi:hypothetical protein
VVSADGIRLFEGNYTCARAINERWFDRARLRGQWTIKVAYDPSNLDLVYLLDPAAPMQFHACHLTDAGAAQRKLSVEEIARLPREADAARVQRGTVNSFASFVA